MKRAISSLGAINSLVPSGVSSMTSLNGPNGDTGHRPTTRRCPVVVPNAAISPSKRQRTAVADRLAERLWQRLEGVTGRDDSSNAARTVADLNRGTVLGRSFHDRYDRGHRPGQHADLFLRRSHALPRAWLARWRGPRLDGD